MSRFMRATRETVLSALREGRWIVLKEKGGWALAGEKSVNNLLRGDLVSSILGSHEVVRVRLARGAKLPSGSEYASFDQLTILMERNAAGAYVREHRFDTARPEIEGRCSADCTRCQVRAGVITLTADADSGVGRVQITEKVCRLCARMAGIAPVLANGADKSRH